MAKQAGVVLGLASGLVVAVAALGQQPLASKKLIEYGWDVPNPAYIRANIREMEKRPFDGLIFRLPGGTNVLSKAKWDEAKFVPVYEDCRNIQWEKFTDNFISVLAASDVDWFSDADWESVRHNLTIVAKAAALARCRGICFDQEPYGYNPWNYPAQVRAKEKTFAEYQVQARKRGAEFIRTITAQMPKPVIHTFFQLCYFGGLMNEPDLTVREQRLSQEYYSLLPAFFNGMLDAAASDVLFTDGNESAYYYTSPIQFYQSFHTVKQRALCLVAPENTRTYQTQMQMSQALYVDYLFALGIWGQRRSPAPALTPAERQQWFEHNTYYALATADEFVWLYSEKMDWWKNVDLPPGLEQAVVSARAKIAAHQPLGFDIVPVIKAAQERRQAELEAKLIRRTADIPKVDQGPVIDGDLSDAVWQNAVALDAFVPYVGVDTKPKVSTDARVAYDAENLYVAVRCPEPNPKAMKPVGVNRDDSVWDGDSVDIFLSQGEAPIPYVHVIVSAGNVVWDGLCGEAADTRFNVNLKSAVRVGQNEWTLEVALPWNEMRMTPPTSGAKLKANLCRQRVPDREQTAWSQTFDGFVEPRNFGTWTLK
ncbi:MAG: hypothetical protein A3K19_01665 [Lentisphaerae bacterium RIFOXYB12_FULL_65_16]|nr:MAG: hypothetical protein A3K18_02800 [Lentisphaerae bacterium RIFOXYA12_64_32]OGV92858.1 MAG: hypothetical protein A3K19_01665 [Lentisphaerae bacterium RIFOXYB12_FULL_65_16]